MPLLLNTWVHVWHYATHSVVVRLTDMSDEHSEQAMLGSESCATATSHEHYRDGACFLRWTDLYNTRESAEKDVAQEAETEASIVLSGGSWGRELQVTVHTAPLFGNATLRHPQSLDGPVRVEVMGASPSVLIVRMETGAEVTMPMVDGLLMHGYTLVMDKAVTNTGPKP